MEAGENKPIDAESLRALKHDIKNQLSTIVLCLEQLRYEINDPLPDWKYYMDTISDGCKTINKILGTE
jgi:hypothetical protein